MMSNPPSSLQSRQKLHQRQHSTPVAFEAMKVQMPPAMIQRQNVHRRGQSYDMTRSPIRRHQHTGSAASINTNIGSIQGHKILREAQQQRMTRPGQQRVQPRVDTSIAQQYDIFPPSQSLPGTPYDMTMNAMMLGAQHMMQHSQNQDMQMPLSAGLQNPYMFDENTQNYFQFMQEMQNGAQMLSHADRRMSQPDLKIQTGLRPYTPTHQIQTAHFPMTPVHTPGHQQRAMQQLQPQQQQSPRWRPQDETIISPRPVSMQKSRSLQGIAEHQEMQSFTQVFDSPSLSTSQPITTAREPVKQRRPGHSKASSLSSTMVGVQSLYGEISDNIPHLEEVAQPILSSSQPPSSPIRPTLSPRRVSISDLNLEPGINASIEETNITLDDISQFIEGPDEENKWICKYEGCDKKFGRKENIKSHVQTHLGDRQFRCDHCKKCFVRGHDLKRHAKIHTGAKAYTCLCGNAFARHDALTRHRQRGMCIGAFEGIVRREIKRGRPRKHRPEMEERVDKASRTRQKKQQEHYASHDDVYASSASSCSMSSWDSPPTETMDHLSIHGENAHSPAMTYDDTLNLFGLASQDMEPGCQQQASTVSQVALPPNMFSYTPPASPGYSTGNKPSPSYRELTPAELATFEDEAEMTQSSGQSLDVFHISQPHGSMQISNYMLDESNHSDQAAIPSAAFELPHMSLMRQDHITTTQATSLPALSHSSSPPPQEPGSALVFDFPDEMNPLRMSTMSNMSFGLSAFTKPTNQETQSAGESTDRNEFDSFLDYNEDSQLSLGMPMSMSNTDAFFASL